MRIALPDWPALALFAATILAVTLYGLTVSGHFPGEHRDPAMRTVAGRLVLWGTIGVALLSGLAAIAFALARLPGYAAVIAGGLAVLVAPLCLRPLPDRFLDGQAGLIAFAGLGAALAVVASSF